LGFPLKSLVFFNNKGGVGKTTLTCNVVSFLNLHKSKRVLLIDADPQCNATQALLEDDMCEAIYLSKKPSAKTLFDYLKPIEAGEPSIDDSVMPLLGTQNAFGTDLIPGHPKMSLIEDILSSAWGRLQAAEPSGFRITNW
jgi:cellulose biosynthesis protein BcsQ